MCPLPAKSKADKIGTSSKTHSPLILFSLTSILGSIKGITIPTYNITTLGWFLQEKNPNPKPQKPFFLPCVCWGGGNYLTHKHLQRFAPPENFKFFFKKSLHRPNAPQPCDIIKSPLVILIHSRRFSTHEIPFTKYEIRIFILQ